MSESIGKNTTSEWYTPEWIFETIGIRFDLDPCAPEKVVPSKRWCNNCFSSNGLENGWFGSVFMNPPWSGSGNERGAIKPWFDKFINHGNGVCIFPSRTSCDWFQKYVPNLDAIMFPDKKIKFMDDNMIEQKQPMQAVCFGAMGYGCVDAIARMNGILIKLGEKK